MYIGFKYKEKLPFNNLLNLYYISMSKNCQKNNFVLIFN